MKYEAIHSTVILSRGAGWVWELPGKPGDYWPDSGQANVIFYDLAGNVVGIVDGSIESKSKLVFQVEPTDVANVNHGYGFELVVTPDDTGIPALKRYGTVVRREVQFPDAPPVDSSDTALYFGDDFERSIIGPRWVVKTGIPFLSNGAVSTKQKLFSLNESCALVFYQPLNGDDITINCTFSEINGGKATMCFSSDSNMSTYLGFQVVKPGSGSATVAIVRGTGPTTQTAFGGAATATSTTVATDNFVIKYNSQTKTVNVYKNNSTTALVTWTDNSNVIPHGEGFRYIGMSFQTTALLTSGPRISSWSAKDGV